MVLNESYQSLDTVIYLIDKRVRINDHYYYHMNEFFEPPCSDVYLRFDSLGNLVRLKEYKFDHNEIIIFPFYSAFKALNGVNDNEGPYLINCNQNIKPGELLRDSLFIRSFYWNGNSNSISIESNYHEDWIQGNWYRYTSFFLNTIGCTYFGEFFRRDNLPYARRNALIKAFINGVIIYPNTYQLHTTTWLEIKQGK
jgi:hypothetical protein